MNINMTNHADQSIRKRGRREADVKFVFNNGTSCKKGVILTKKDAKELIFDAKRTIKLAERLKGTFLACDGNTVITVFRATTKQQKRILSDQ